MTVHLYTTTDVKKVRMQLHKEQDGRCLLTMEPLDERQAVLDHCHKTQFVRGVLHRQANATLGKLEGLWTRYLSYWYPGTLPSFLRQAAAYLERDRDSRWYHPGWIKKASTLFNALSETQKSYVLSKMQLQGSNSKERKELFRKAILTRSYDFDTIQLWINEAKEQ